MPRGMAVRDPMSPVRQQIRVWDVTGLEMSHGHRQIQPHAGARPAPKAIRTVIVVSEATNLVVAPTSGQGVALFGPDLVPVRRRIDGESENGRICRIGSDAPYRYGPVRTSLGQDARHAAKIGPS